MPRNNVEKYLHRGTKVCIGAGWKEGDTVDESEGWKVIVGTALLWHRAEKNKMLRN